MMRRDVRTVRLPYRPGNWVRVRAGLQWLVISLAALAFVLFCLNPASWVFQ